MNRPGILARGNVDGQVCAALAIRFDTRTKPCFVPHSGVATRFLRADLSHNPILVADLALEPEFVRTLNRKAAAGLEVHVVDHHQASLEQQSTLDSRIHRFLETGYTASGLLQRHLGVDYDHLVAIADAADCCHSPVYEQAVAQHGDRIETEARMLDFAWRLDIHDDAFRHVVARRLAAGLWPSQILEVQRRYRRMQLHWDSALRHLESRIKCRGDVAILDASTPTRLHGFGQRALVEVARRRGAGISCRIMRNRHRTHVSLRRARIDHATNLGAFIRDFTREHGFDGGGHPDAAGGRIPHATTPQFLEELCA